MSGEEEEEGTVWNSPLNIFFKKKQKNDTRYIIEDKNTPKSIKDLHIHYFLFVWQIPPFTFPPPLLSYCHAL